MHNADLAAASTSNELWYPAPARQWVEALPIGNGRLGGMVFGGAATERVALNESTLWSGSPVGRAAPESSHLMPEIRAAVLRGDPATAERLVRQQQGPFTEAYMPLGDLSIRFDGVPESVEAYRRSLDLARAVTVTRFTVAGVTHTRETFASAADGAIVMRLTADRPGQISFTANLDTPLGFKAVRPDGADTLVLTGKAPLNAMPSYRGGKLTYAETVDGEGMTFDARLRVIAEGGSVRAGVEGVRVEGADAVTLVLCAATSYNGPDRSPGLDGRDPSALATKQLADASARSFAALLDRHLADYQGIFRRVTLDLGPATTGDRPTSDRVVAWRDARGAGDPRGSRDPALAALLFQYGRYLLISSSRPGGPAANLQGLWNDKTSPPWSSNYTTNINAEMNYWPAEPANLPECVEPLVDLIRAAAATGHETARHAYGARGWCVHHNSDLWGTSWAVGSGEGDPVWSCWPMGAAWLVHHVWERHAFAPDAAFLRDTAYPLMKGAAEFCLDLLVDDGHGRLVTIPSTSPETPFTAPDGKRHAVTAAATMDMALVRELFRRTSEAADLLGVDAEFATLLRETARKLVPYQTSADGTLAEWGDPTLKAVDPQHRHVSHLIGLYPLADAALDRPERIEAVRRTLAQRGDDSTGWSLAWKLNLWARLLDGEHCLGLMDYIFRPVEFGGAGNRHGGVYLNLFGAHPPFQIDGNFGFTSGVAEMLLQSHAGVIHLLPALPKAWPTGRVTGLRSRGGFELDITWADGALVEATIRSTGGRDPQVQIGDRTRTVVLAPGTSVRIDAGLATSPE